MNSRLAGAIQQCWHVPPEVTRHVSEPLAAMADRYLPEAAKRTAEVGMDPLQVVVGMWRILEHCRDNEKAILAQFVAASRVPRGEAPQNDSAPVVDPGSAAQDAASFDLLAEAA